MKELGNLLRERREAVGLTLDDMEQQTKIRKRYLEAIEEGDWTPLPGIVYARGFVRSMADHLGLNGRELLARFVDRPKPDPSEITTGSGSSAKESKTYSQRKDVQSPNATVTKPAHRVEPTSVRSDSKTIGVGAAPLSASQFRSSARSRPVRSRPSKGWIGQTVAVVGILAVLGGGWWWITHKPHASLPHVSSKAGVVASGANTTTQSSHVRTSAKTQNNSSMLGQGTGSSETVNHPAVVEKKPKSVNVIAQPLNGQNLVYLVKTSKPLSVVLSAPSVRLWTLVKADGQTVDSAGGEILAVGTAKPYTAAHSLTFQIGNVPAAHFTVDGKPVTLPNVNQVLYITFKKMS